MSAYLNCQAKREQHVFPIQQGTQVQCHLAEAHVGDHYDMYWGMRWRQVTDYDRDKAILASKRTIERVLNGWPTDA